jgi:outer membrane lipopolysaccharide assembly protein LptE/RlpB
MLKSHNKICLILLGFLLLSGCGFKLRTVNSLPPQLHRIYYQTDNPYGQFEIALKRVLKASKVNLIATPGANTPILHVTSNYTSSTTSSITSAAARVYTLSYTATVSVTDAANKQLLSPQTTSASRAVTLQSNEVFEITPQIDIAKQELQQELANKILNILCAKRTFQALAK